MRSFAIRVRATTHARLSKYCIEQDRVQGRFVARHAREWLTAHEGEDIGHLSPFDAMTSFLVEDGDRERLRAEASRRGITLAQLLDTIVNEAIDAAEKAMR